jgi:hypothetical protein
MADFPALEPVRRAYTFGAFPVTEETGFGGGSVRFLHGSFNAGHELELQFEYITADEVKLVRDHYRGQQGSLLAFQLSAAAKAGNTHIDSLGATKLLWKYAGPPEESHRSGNLFDLTVVLESVV